MAADAKLPKPAFGDPCNRCGRCCEVWLCSLATLVFYRRSSDIPGPCRALIRHDDGTSSCGLMADPARFAPMQTLAHGRKAMSAAAATLICAGTVCDAHHTGEPPVPWRLQDRVMRMAKQRMVAGKEARKLWGV